MQNPKITNSDSLSDEVQIDLNVLCPLMLNWIGDHVDRTDVIRVHQYSTPKRGVQLLK